MKRIIVVLLLLAPALFAQTSTASAGDIQELKDAMAAQQQQIQRLSRRLEQYEQNAQNATANSAAASQTPASQPQTAKLKDVVLNTSSADNTAPQEAPQTAQETEPVTTSEMEGPLTIRFRGISITPGGFAAAEFVRRSQALGADVSTPFNTVPLPDSSQSKESEFFGSARQSRPTVYVLTHVKSAELSSYLSADFLSAGVTSTSTQTNSYTLRLRQVWGQAKFDSGWSFLGGQAWSLVTESKFGIRPSDDAGKTNDARPATIDAGYNVGFSFARQYGLRVTKDFGDKVWLAVAIENPEATVTTHGNADNYLLGEEGASNSFNTAGNYSYNPSPDIISKLAFDPGFGHYEVFGIYDRFADRVYPCVDISKTVSCGSPAGAPVTYGAYNTSINGAGFGANARWTLAHKHIVFGLHGFGGNGVGRYGAAQLSDLSVRADGSLSLIRGYQGLSTLEWHGKKFDVYAYGGAEYANRTAQVDPTTNKSVGYGSSAFNNSACYTEAAPGSGVTTPAGFNPGTTSSCTGDTRAVVEGTGGFWYRFYNGPKGRFQFGTQYSYLTRNTWAGTGGLPKGSAGLAPHGVDDMVFTSFRYYLP